MCSMGYNRTTEKMSKKKIFVCVIAIIVIASTAFCQSDNQDKSHKTYMIMGVDCNGNIKDVIENFKRIGYDKVSPLNEHYVLASSEKSLSKIVLFIANDRIDHIALYQYYGSNYAYYPSWDALKNGIINLGNMLAEEYSVDHVNHFEFSNPYTEGDGKEFEAICSKNAIIFSYMETPKQDSDLGAIKIRTSTADPKKMWIITEFLRLDNLYEK